MEPFATMAAAAEDNGDITALEARRWLRQLRDSSERGSFLWAVAIFLVSATRP
jgi:hypothetical protein